MPVRADNSLRSRARRIWRAARGDGCTASPDFQYSHCCNRHDADYSAGADGDGNPLTRKEADKRLLECMRKESNTFVGKWFVSTIYYVAVRIFGGSQWHQK